MAFLGTPNSFIGIDIGTSSLKIVELLRRRRRLEVATYAQAPYVNPLVAETVSKDAMKATTNLLQEMFEKAGASSDQAVVALPAAAVFSTVITMPNIPEAEMEKAVEFAAKDVVPANLEDMVLGYSRLGQQPHLDIETQEQQSKETKVPVDGNNKQAPTPVFITAAPKYVVNRYVKLIESLEMKLIALELETFPLARSLLSEQGGPAMIVDIGDKATTFHIIDSGTPRVSHTIEFGGADITQALSKAISKPENVAEQLKFKHGLKKGGGEQQQAAIQSTVRRQIKQAKQLISVYETQNKRKVSQTVLIGGRANLPGLADFWIQESGHKTTVGNPWRGL